MFVKLPGIFISAKCKAINTPFQIISARITHVADDQTEQKVISCIGS